MNILWTSNITFRDASQAFGIPSVNNEGWLISLAQSLIKFKEISLTIVSFYEGEEMKQINIDGINYIALPIKDHSDLSKYWEKIVETYKPNLVHINGTEYEFALSLILTYPELKYVLSIQGLVGVISRYIFTGFTLSELILHPFFTLRMIRTQQSFRKKGNVEKDYIKRCKQIIGRTQWDKVHTHSIYQGVNYHFCNESLRSIFYETKWNIQNIERYSIFLSQANYSIKGLHIALKAFEIVKQTYPRFKIYIAGNNLTKPRKGLFHKITHNSSYGFYISNKIEMYQLTNNIFFLGNLEEDVMALRFSLSHVFVCPSTIENSPNSLGEAQLIGTPVVASFVGGIPDMVLHGETGLLYRLEEYEMLASHILDIFNNDTLASKLSAGGRLAAAERHDKTANAIHMLNIYNEILNTD